jgi:hypothetical protein
MARNRVIYQSEALYVGPSPAVSGYFTDKTLHVPDGYVGYAADALIGAAWDAGGDLHPSGNQIRQLHRIQTANYSFNIPRTDINQFGELAAIDRVVMDTPTVALDFSYILATMENEQNLGFVTDGHASCISGILNKTSDEKNYFIKTVGEGRDAVGDRGPHNDAAGTMVGGGVGAENEYEFVIGVGNGFLTSYTTECSVGNFPTCTVNVEGLNMTFESGVSGASPAVKPESGTRLSHFKYVLPTTTGSPETGIMSTSALRPGDITFAFAKRDREAVQLSGEVFQSVTADEDTYDAPGAHLGNMDSKMHAKIQSYNISLDMAREPINRLGSRFAFSREITFPMTVTCTIDALVADLTTGSLSDLINCDDSYDIVVNLLRPVSCPGTMTDGTAKDIFAQYWLKNAKVNSQAFSSDIGSNKSVTMEFATQVGGPSQKNQGLFMSGITTGRDTAGFIQRDDSADS